MIIFLNDESAYHYWVTHHRLGFVLDGRRKPQLNHFVLHRADCTVLKGAKRHYWTTRGHLKACSLDRAELESWAAEECDDSVEHCPHCQPALDRPGDDSSDIHLTKLGGEILEYVLEAALIHMEQEHPPYRLSIDDIAACFAKSPGQLVQTLQNLLDQGLLTASGAGSRISSASGRRHVFPTAKSLRTLDAFRDASEADIAHELEKLHADQSGE
ncbi:MAG TPA: hypothetical protein VFV87_00880 [Pirellulaceae bacterium]|nr:hypothetical protein [Pirellulaceae bacterium]